MTMMSPIVLSVHYIMECTDKRLEQKISDWIDFWTLRNYWSVGQYYPKCCQLIGCPFHSIYNVVMF